MDRLSMVVEKIKKMAVKIRDIEERAGTSLYVDKNEDEYRRLLIDKTLLLFHFPENIEEDLRDMDSDLSKFIRQQIGGFAHGAEKALAINSIFYMSALLYPENYQSGDDNDLEVFLQNIQGKQQVSDQRTIVSDS